MLSYKYRIYPSKTVERNLCRQIELCRWLYNRLLEELNKARDNGEKITQRDTQALIPHLKDEKPELKTVNSKVLQMVNYQLWSNIKGLSKSKENGRKIGKLRFKGKGWFKTMNYNQSGFALDWDKCKLRLSKVGEIPIKLHREVKGTVKSVIVKREKSGKWFAVMQVEDEPEPLPPTDSQVGIDVGIKYFLSDSDGNQVENPRFYEKTLEKIAKLQKELSRKVKGSNNWHKCRQRLAKAYERLLNQRNDFLHKLSRYYVNNYDLIAVEDLNVSGLSRSRLARKILDASWSKFFNMVSYKAERAGREVMKVAPHHTSQQNKQIKDRDYRASLNILNKCLSGLGQSLVPVEEKPLHQITAKAVVMGQVSPKKQEAPCESWG